VLVVQDQGIGIPAADIPHVFTLFHRGINRDHGGESGRCGDDVHGVCASA